jgi:hypothetical protein
MVSYERPDKGVSVRLAGLGLPSRACRIAGRRIGISSLADETQGTLQPLDARYREAYICSYAQASVRLPCMAALPVRIVRSSPIRHPDATAPRRRESSRLGGRRRSAAHIGRRHSRKPLVHRMRHGAVMGWPWPQATLLLATVQDPGPSHEDRRRARPRPGHRTPRQRDQLSTPLFRAGPRRQGAPEEGLLLKMTVFVSDGRRY